MTHIWFHKYHLRIPRKGCQYNRHIQIMVLSIYNVGSCNFCKRPYFHSFLNKPPHNILQDNQNNLLGNPRGNFLRFHQDHISHWDTCHRHLQHHQNPHQGFDLDYLHWGNYHKHHHICQYLNFPDQRLGDLGNYRLYRVFHQNRNRCRLKNRICLR